MWQPRHRRAPQQTLSWVDSEALRRPCGCSPAVGPGAGLCSAPLWLSHAWHSRFPVVNCSDPGFLENAVRHGQQSVAESFEFGESVLYHCKKGFYMLGSSALTCTADGLWDRSLPKCLGE